MTGLQLALVAGGLVGVGVALLIMRLLPADPDLGDALQRLSPEHAKRHAGQAAHPTGDARERLGAWGMKTLPPGVWGAIPTRELAILRMSVTRYYGEKVVFAGLGLLIPPLLATFFTLLGVQLPVAIPVIASLVLAAAMFFLPNYNVRDDAKKARAEFARALGAYIDLVALERNSGAGPRQALEVAAAIGDSWVFRRISEELARTRYSGLTPWDALHELSLELGLTELDDLADIMRLSGEEGTQIYRSLRARSAGLRSAMLSAEKKKANEVGEKMSIPMSLLGVIFLAILIAPALLRMMGDAA